MPESFQEGKGKVNNWVVPFTNGCRLSQVWVKITEKVRLRNRKKIKKSVDKHKKICYNKLVKIKKKKFKKEVLNYGRCNP